MELIRTDDLTIYWSLCFVAAYAISKLLKPQRCHSLPDSFLCGFDILTSLVHPLLLGRQSDVGRVRMPSESPVYRNYATGSIGRVSYFILLSNTHISQILLVQKLPERPKPEVRTLVDIISNGKAGTRRLWSKDVSLAQD